MAGSTRVSGPEVDRLKASFRRIDDRLSENQRRLLDELLAAPEGRSATELAAALGLQSHAPVNRMFGGMGRLIAEAGGEHPSQRRNGTYRWWRMLADGAREAETGRWIWRLQPAVRAALEQIRSQAISSSTPDTSDGHLLPGELADDGLYSEGAIRKVTVNAYERNPKARELCLAHHQPVCAACEMSFEEVYGPEVAGFIHVHHIKPLSTVGSGYTVNPVEDLKPLCPNCHAVAHLGGGEAPRSIEEIREMIAAQRKV